MILDIDEVSIQQGRFADLVDGISNGSENLSSLSLSEKLPGGSHSKDDNQRYNTEDVKKFGEELKAGVSTISDFWKEFKDYIENGDIIDDSLSMAAGQSFSDVMNSFVMDLVIPIFATLLGKPNASNFFLILKSGKDVNAKYRNIKEAKSDGASVLPYGKFLQKAMNFVFLGVTLVLFVRMTRTVLFFRQKSLKEKKEREQKLMEIECPHCITKISKKATRCPNCTSTLSNDAYVTVMGAYGTVTQEPSGLTS